MKTIMIPGGKKEEVIKWCLDNFGTEDVRWWQTPTPRVWDHNAGRWGEDATITVDVTEEEETMLTLFMLKWKT